MEQLILKRGEAKRSFSYTCSLIAIYLLAVCSIFSPVRALESFNTIWSVLFGAWVIFTLFDTPDFILLPTRLRLLMFIYIIYTIGVAYLTGNGVIGNRFLDLAQIPLFYMAYEKNKQTNGNIDNFWIIGMVVPFVLYTGVVTFFANLKDHWVSRTIAAKTPGSEIYLKLGVGSYEYIYFLVIVTGVFLFVIYNRNKPLKRTNTLVIALMLVAFAVIIVMTNFSTALFLLLLCAFMRVFVPRINAKYWLLYFVSGAVAIFLLSNLSLFFLDNLTSLLGNSLNASRVNEIKDLLMKNQLGDSMDSRMEKWLLSINSFWEHPFLGILTKRLSYYDGFLSGFGQHSQILDTFALYGAGIGVLQIYIYIKPFTARLKSIKGYISGLPLLIMVVFFIMVTLDNATASIGFAAFFIFPTVYDWLIKRKPEVGQRNISIA